MSIKKDSTVRVKGDTWRGLGFVHYILPDGMALVEFQMGIREWIFTYDLIAEEA